MHEIISFDRWRFVGTFSRPTSSSDDLLLFQRLTPTPRSAGETRVIARHAGTVLVGQLAAMAFGVTDTIVAGRYDESRWQRCRSAPRSSSACTCP